MVRFDLPTNAGRAPVFGGEELAVWGIGSLDSEYRMDSKWSPYRTLCIQANPVPRVVLLSVTGGQYFLSIGSKEVIKTAWQQILFGGYVAQWMHVFGRQ